MNGNPVELDKSFSLRDALVYEYRIQVFHIRQADKLVNCGIVPDIPFQFGVLLTPHLGGHAEHRYIQHIGFISIDNAGLFGCHLWRDKVLFYGWYELQTLSR